MTTFFIFFITLSLLLLSALFSTLRVGLLSLNHYVLKKRAQSGDKGAKLLYPIRELGNQLKVSLLIGNILVNAIVVGILLNHLNDIVAIMLSVVLLLLAELLPLFIAKKHGFTVASAVYPVLKQYILILAPITRPIGRLVDSLAGQDGHDIQSKEELYKILDNHEASEHSDIEQDEIHLVKHALRFGDKQVREIMTPKRMVVRVAVEDSVGPILIDELHKSGHSRFPVYDDKKAEHFVGTLYLRDLVGLQVGGLVKNAMRKEVYYVHEEQLLDHALNAFLTTNHHLLIVVNSFEEFVGVVSVEDVLEQIIGRPIVDEFDQYEDLRAVAKSLAEKELQIRKKQSEKSKK